MEKKEATKIMDKAAKLMTKVFNKQAPGSIKVKVTWDPKGQDFIVSYGKYSYGIFVDYGTYDYKTNPLNLPSGAKPSPRGFEEEEGKEGIAPRFFTVLSPRDKQRVESIIAEAQYKTIELNFEQIAV